MKSFNNLTEKQQLESLNKKINLLAHRILETNDFQSKSIWRNKMTKLAIQYVELSKKLN